MRGGLFRIDVDDRHRYVATSGCSDKVADVDPRIETKQREIGAQHVVERSSIAQPQMRRAASRHGRLAELIDRIGWRRLAVVSNDRRARIEISKVEAAAAELSDVDVVSLPTDTRAYGVAFRANLFNGIWNGAPLRCSRQCGVHRIV